MVLISLHRGFLWAAARRSATSAIDTFRSRPSFTCLLLALIVGACGGGSGGGSTPVTDTPPQSASDDTWRAPANELPADGSYVYLVHSPAGNAAAAKRYLYTQVSSVLAIGSMEGRLSVTVKGNESWFGEMQLPESAAVLIPATYDGLQRYPDHDPARGGLQWWGVMDVCKDLGGWLVIDAAAYSDGRLIALEARFEQSCAPGDVLRGQIRWRADDTSRPPGPVPIPADLWQAPAAGLPAGGNYVYVDSAPADPLGRGVQALHTSDNAAMWSEQVGGYFAIHIRGDHYWDGEFQVMQAEPRLSVGYYGDLRRFPFHNPAKGGLSWSQPDHFCDAVRGWFAVDAVSYTPQGWLSKIELRFEQVCEGQTAPLRGKLRWSISDPNTAPGPVLPVPDTLWQPLSGATPTSTHWYALSTGVDPIGHGNTFLLTPPEAGFAVQATGGILRWQVQGDELWTAEFVAMDVLTQIQPGFYDNLRRPGLHNPTRGALTVTKNGRVCSSVEGWVAVDAVLYVDGVLQEVDLRFEQRCEGTADPLNGRLLWRASEPIPVTQAANKR
jgi:hypothetical protein